jgi:hypothetical protein
MEVIVKTLRSLFKPFHASNGRFDRYYGGVLRSGSGYPTADEARKDMRNHDQMSSSVIGWIR